MKVTNSELKQIKIPGRLHPLPVFFWQRPAMLGTSFDETKGQTRARVQVPSFQYPNAHEDTNLYTINTPCFEHTNNHENTQWGPKALPGFVSLGYGYRLNNLQFVRLRHDLPGGQSLHSRILDKDGLEKVTPLQIWRFWISILAFWVVHHHGQYLMFFGKTLRHHHQYQGTPCANRHSHNDNGKAIVSSSWSFEG